MMSPNLSDMNGLHKGMKETAFGRLLYAPVCLKIIVLHYSEYIVNQKFPIKI